MLKLREGTQYQLISIEGVQKIIGIQEKTPFTMSIDLETTGLNCRSHKIVTVQFGTVGRAFILDCRPYYDASTEEQAVWRDTLQKLVKVCPLLIGHNLKFDVKFLAHHFDIRVGKVADTMLQELVILGVGLGRAESAGYSVNMFDTASRYGLHVSKEQRSWFIGLDEREEWSMPFPEEQIAYCAQDVYTPLLMHDAQAALLEQYALQATANLENTCLPAIARMEVDGCYVDRDKWAAIIAGKKQLRAALQAGLEQELTPYIQEVRQVAYEQEKQALESWQHAYDYMLEQLRKKHAEGGIDMQWGKFKNAGMKLFREECPRPSTPRPPEVVINIGSHEQLKTALAHIGVCVDSTDKEHLAPFKKTVPIVERVLAWKELDKFINAFGDTLLDKIEEDGRIHPNYNQIGAATGRMSCSSPNWQQIPSHEPEETSVRRCVIGQGDNVLLTADFSNIEARILAEISQDTALLDFFRQGGDLHSTTARLMFNLPEDVNPKTAELRVGLTYRSIAKTINFGLIYGMSPMKLGASLGVSLEEAEKLFNRYFEAYPSVKEWLDRTSQQALENGYSLTLAGRKRFYRVMPEPHFDRDTMAWEDFMLQRSQFYKMNGSYARQAKNAPIQGTSADITKYALALLYKHLPAYVKIAACVHDEIVLECPEEKAHAVAKLFATAMFTACKKYLHTVHIPPVEVEIERYWKKG